MSERDKIIIFDTTLRDGEQSPGATMTVNEKIAIAEILDEMRIDVIEAGFARASEGDFEAIKKIGERSKNAIIASLARAIDGDIEAAGEALKDSPRKRIHTFVSTSDIHIEHQLRSTRENVLELVKRSVTLARNYTDDVEWSGMDASRSDKDFFCKAAEIAINAGATTVNVPDTVGYTTPQEYFEFISYIKNNVPNIDKAIISTHCHNDLGMATANSLAAIDAGARQLECAVNGLGERAGNASMEEIVMAIDTRGDSYNAKTDVDTKQIMRVSKLVSNVTGFTVQKNKAIVGTNAFAHESGIHQDGMLKNRDTYEIMTPESVGWTKTSLVLGKHSGRAAFKDKLEQLGIVLGDNSFQEVFDKFKALADRKKNVYDDDLIQLIDNKSIKDEALVSLKDLKVWAGSDGQKAEVTLNINGEDKSATSEGNGAVDAMYKAIREIYPHEAHLALYQVSSVTQGIDAQAEVLVRLEGDNGLVVNGNAANLDTMIASAAAYISALNKLAIYGNKIKPERQEGVFS